MKLKKAKCLLCVAGVAFAGVAAFGNGQGAGVLDPLEQPRAEFAKYYRQIVGKEMPEGLVRLMIDPKVSESGRDAYLIRSGGRASTAEPAKTASVQQQEGSSLPAVTITGSNVRSVYYGVYDLLERRGGCRWFWDGDVVPKKGALDLSGLDVSEEAHFEYRGLRYFAHRGLTRFQAEQKLVLTSNCRKTNP